MVKIADTYFLQKDYSRAKELYLEIEQRSPSGDFMPVVLLRLAQITSRQGKWDERSKYIRRIKSKYPKASEMKFVKVLEALGDFFTIQVGAFSIRKNALLLVEVSKRGLFPIYRQRKKRTAIFFIKCGLADSRIATMLKKSGLNYLIRDILLELSLNKIIE